MNDVSVVVCCIFQNPQVIANAVYSQNVPVPSSRREARPLHIVQRLTGRLAPFVEKICISVHLRLNNEIDYLDPYCSQQVTETVQITTTSNGYK